MIQDGKKIKFHYTLYADEQPVEDAEGKSFEYVHGQDKILNGLKEQLEGMQEGEEKTIVLSPEKAYGFEDPQAVKELSRSHLPEDLKPELGQTLQINTATGHKAYGVITGIRDDSVVLDFNHPLAGKTLTFKVKIMAIS